MTDKALLVPVQNASDEIRSVPEDVQRRHDGSDRGSDCAAPAQPVRRAGTA